MSYGTAMGINLRTVVVALVALVALVAYPAVLLVCLYLRLSFSLLHAANSNLAIDV